MESAVRNDADIKNHKYVVISTRNHDNARNGVTI